MPEFKPGYHMRPIERGVYGEPSKVREEAEEFVEASEQGNPIMALVELADLYGAIRGYLTRHHPTMTMAHIECMADATERAFLNGKR